MKKSMTSRERVVTAMHRGVPDRVPLNYESNHGLNLRLRKHFGLDANDHEGVLERLQVDFRGAHAPYVGKPLHAPREDCTVNSEWGYRTRWIEHSTGGYSDFCDFPLKDATDEEIAAWPLPSPDDYDYSVIATRCAKFPDHALSVGDPGMGDIINSTGFLLGVERIMMEIIDPDSVVQELIDRRTAQGLARMERSLEAGKGRIDFLWLGEDLGTQRGPLISLDTYRQFIKPRQKKFADLAKSYNIPVMLHSCGASSWVYGDLVEIGITVVDTLQPEAVGMSPATLKKDWGDKLAFHGCISTAGVVATGTVEDTRRDVRDTLDIMMPGGGYCLAPTHSLQDNSPTENVLAMYETALEYGKY